MAGIGEKMERTSLTLRIPDDLHAAIKALADASERSFNSQVIHMIKHSLVSMQVSSNRLVVSNLGSSDAQAFPVDEWVWHWPDGGEEE